MSCLSQSTRGLAEERRGRGRGKEEVEDKHWREGYTRDSLADRVLPITVQQMYVFTYEYITPLSSGPGRRPPGQPNSTEKISALARREVRACPMERRYPGVATLATWYKPAHQGTVISNTAVMHVDHIRSGQPRPDLASSTRKRRAEQPSSSDLAIPATLLANRARGGGHP